MGDQKAPFSTTTSPKCRRGCYVFQVSRTLLSILAVLSNDIVWMVSTRSLTSKSSNPFNCSLVMIPNAPITNRHFHVPLFFLNSLARSRYLSLFSLSFSFILLIIIRSGLLAEIKWSVCKSKSLYPWYVPHNSECLAWRYLVPFFVSLWYNSTWNWTPISRTIGEHSTHKTNEPVLLKRIIIIIIIIIMKTFVDMVTIF